MTDHVILSAQNDLSWAASRAGVTIRDLEGPADYEDLCRLVGRAFHVDDRYFVNPAVLNQVVVGGGHLVGAYRDGELVGSAVGFLGRYRGQPSMHSLLAAVVPELQHHGVGYAIKLAQRYWAVSHGIELVTWTYDTLNARNAYFNIAKLGAALTGYLVDPIGPLPPPMVHARSESDMGVVCWRIRQPLPGSEPEESITNLPAPILLDADDEGRPVISPIEAETFQCRIPDDIAQLRRADPDLARDWVHAVRETLARALARGYEARLFLRPGTYILSRGSSA